MKLLMIRHGKPTYKNVDDLNLVSYLSELTDEGIAQAELVARDERLQDADIIIASPFTRALQTAAIISRVTQIPIRIEPAFHELLLDTTHADTVRDEYTRPAYREFISKNGIRDENTKYRWEELTHVVERSYKAMQKYLEYSKVIVVAHSVLIRTFGYCKPDFGYCEIFEREFDKNSKFEGFVGWRG